MPVSIQRLIQSRWPWLAASLILTASLFVSTTLGWLWYADQRASTARQTSLDLLWLEQIITHKLSVNQYLIDNWAHDLVPASPKANADFISRIDNLMKENPALVAIDYLDRGNRRVVGMPHYAERPDRLPPINDPLIAEAVQRSYTMKNVVYSRVIEQYAPLWVLVIPTSDDPEKDGVVLAIYDLDQLLAQEVPWWFVQRYDLSLVDRDNKQLSPRDGVLAQKAEDIHKLAFGPDNSGLSLRASPHARGHSELLLGLLALAVVLLGTLIVWLLRVLQRWLRERQAAQQALARELRFREAMEHSLVTGLLAFDRGGRIIYANPALCSMLGLRNEALVGAAAPFPFWPQDDMAECQEAHEAMLRGENPAGGRSLNLQNADGTPLSVRLFASPLVDGDSLPSGWMVSLYDITAERQAANTARERDELLQHTARLASLAEFGSGIAHELNQPLAAIANYSAAADSFIEVDPPQMHKVQEAVRRMGEESRRAGKIVHSMRSFIQKRSVRHETHDLLGLLAEPLALLEPLAQRLRSTIAVEGAAEGGQPIAVECDAVMIEQVLFNLIRNALEAIGTQDNRTEHETVSVRITHAADSVVVQVSDRGPGIADPDKLFQAFYSTKSEGMGLGLAICRTVIESHGGRLWAEPNPGGGACFSFRLPCVAQ